MQQASLSYESAPSHTRLAVYRQHRTLDWIFYL